MHLDKYQSTVLAYLFDKLPMGEDVNTLEFSLSGGFLEKFRAAYAAITYSDIEINIVFNIPSYSHSVFLGLSRNNHSTTARVLANIEDYERETGVQLGFGNVVVMTDQTEPDRNMPFAVILLRTATAIDFEKVPDKETINNEETSFFLAVPLVEREYKLWHQDGHDALMDLFVNDNKELFLS